MGTKLLESLVQVAKAGRLDRVLGHVFSENRGMLKVCERVGFNLIASSHDVAADVRAELDVRANPGNG